MYLRNMGILVSLILPIGVLLAGLLLPASHQAPATACEGVRAFAYFWLLSAPLVALGCTVQHVVMWMWCRVRQPRRGRTAAMLTSPLILTWWLLPTSWPVEPSLRENPMLALPFVFVVAAYAALVRPLRALNEVVGDT